MTSRSAMSLPKPRSRSLLGDATHMRDRLLGPAQPPALTPLDQEAVIQRWNQRYAFRFLARNLSFLHIGKCGGTTIMADFSERGIFLEEDHMRRPFARPGWVFLWVRHPMDRFVSAFNHAKNILDFDPGGLSADDLSIENCPAPSKVRRRMTEGVAFAPDYDALVQTFESANALAESLSSSDPELAARAEALFGHRQEHIAKGIGFYLSNGRWVKQHNRRILFVGCLEAMEQDFQRLLEKLDWDILSGMTPSHRRVGAKTYPSGLSDRAKQNLRARFRETEYPALEALAAHGHLSKERLEAYLA